MEINNIIINNALMGGGGGYLFSFIKKRSFFMSSELLRGDQYENPYSNGLPGTRQVGQCFSSLSKR